MTFAICFHNIGMCSALCKSSGADLYLYTCHSQIFQLVSYVYLASAFPLTFRLIGESPNFFKTIVPNALKGCLCALNFVPIRH